MTPIQAINTLFHTLGVPARRLPIIDDMIRERVVPGQRHLLDQDMPADRAQVWQAANAAIDRVIPADRASRDRLLLAFLTLVCDGDRSAAQRLLPHMVHAIGLN
jgi:hypothetical protein